MTHFKALIERSVRVSIKTMKIESFPIFRERKECESRTADRLLFIFSNMQFHRLLIRRHVDEVPHHGTLWSPEKILKMTEIDPERYVLQG